VISGAICLLHKGTMAARGGQLHYAAHMTATTIQEATNGRSQAMGSGRDFWSAGRKWLDQCSVSSTTTTSVDSGS